MKHPLHVTSEIGELQSVLLHRPGKELENLTPDFLERLLFDDIPYLPAVQKEHDYFAKTLQNRGIEVLYLEKLAAEALHKEEVRVQFVEEILKESKSNIQHVEEDLKEYLLSLSNEKMVETLMAGIRKKEIPKNRKMHLYEMLEDIYPFYLDPMPNLYFTRDPAATIGSGLTINRMSKPARRRESLFMEYIIKYHPRFSSHEIPVWIDRDYRFSIEGGDELVLGNEIVAIGISERTTAQAIERLAISLFQKNSGFKKVLAIEIPKKRAFMHLDTVFTMVDVDKFTIHPAILGPAGEMNIYILEPGEDQESVKITTTHNLIDTLKAVLGKSEVVLIPCGGGDPIASEREQWNDGSNTLAIAPGVVVTYDRNYVSNELLRQHGLEVIEVQSSELARGRGGPRCMSMPLVRKDL
ncbi:arginine deiminase [Rubeoparvulum massiliense]|uniref:arginine deiminase n=1 Tax=Rubeoparvulum massiliense TaxID=1631346 RepID=UPI00065E6C2E|nr:arginine deiminase [Rubeoparvulum massiliense]